MLQAKFSVKDVNLDPTLGSETGKIRPCIIVTNDVYNQRVPVIQVVPIFFYSFDCNEPIHVHVRREKMVCKFWLDPITLCENHGFTPKELNRIRRIIQINVDKIFEAWHEHCG